ncbi:hypothetical protein VPHD181_0184 [Vibrio phage D181]
MSNMNFNQLELHVLTQLQQGIEEIEELTRGYEMASLFGMNGLASSIRILAEQRAEELSDELGFLLNPCGNCEGCSGHEVESDDDRLVRKLLEVKAAVEGGAKSLTIDSDSAPNDAYLASLIASLILNFPELKLIVDGEDLDEEDEELALPGAADSMYGMDPEADIATQAQTIFEDMSEQEGFLESPEVDLMIPAEEVKPLVIMVAELINANFPDKGVNLLTPKGDEPVEDELTAEDFHQYTFNHGFKGVSLEELLAPVPEFVDEDRMKESDLLKTEVMRKAIEEDGLSFHEAYELADMS